MSMLVSQDGQVGLRCFNGSAGISGESAVCGESVSVSCSVVPARKTDTCN